MMDQHAIPGRVGIITRTKDRPLLLRRAISSIANQSFRDWRLVIVNDGGDAHEIERLLGEFGRDVRTKTVLIDNPTSVGMEAASNIGVKNSGGDYLAIHDDDDSWSPKFLETCVDYLDAREHETKVGGVVTHCLKVIEQMNDDRVIELYHEPHNTWLKSISYAKVAGYNLFPPISFVFRRRIISDIGHFREELPVLGDWDFNLRFLKKYEIHVIPEVLALYHHRRLPENINYGSSVMTRKDLHHEYEKRIRDEINKYNCEDNKRINNFRSGPYQNPIESSWQLVQMTVSPYMKEKLENFLGDSQRIVIFGASLSGRSWKYWFDQHMPNLDICYFLDNDSEKKGKTIDGIMVKSLESFNPNEFDAIVVASSEYHEIGNQLSQLSLIKGHDFFIL